MLGIGAAMMKSPVVLVAVALTAAILLAASLLIATGTRGEDAARPSFPHHLSSPAKAADPVFQSTSLQPVGSP
jgi:hypothetical protein